MLTDETPTPCLEHLDLRQVAKILNSVFPHYSLCDCARMVADFAPHDRSVCTLCPPGTYPACVKAGAAQQAS